ncbi:helix-turn-helix domain-containing protein [Oceanicaulis sp.]|uniref:helix-turn-helix domain-containing protein n=1 Tax=Oceanicaulis sp. TaxID=1924941 RepID=UPI003D2A9B50
MSHYATSWAVQQKGIRPAAKVVLWHLADRHHPDHGCFPSQIRLAEDCEMSRSSLNDQLDTLEEAGLIKRKQRINPKTKRVESTRYIFAFEMDLTPDHDEPCPKIRHGAVSENDDEPCPKKAQNHVRNSDTNLVREPVREPVTGARVELTQTDCDQFWAAYPEAGRVSYARADLPLALGRHVMRLGSPARLIGAARNYAAAIRKQDTKPKSLVNWLASPALVDQYAPDDATDPTPTDAARWDDAQWRRVVGYFDRHGEWHAPGPMPGRAGCQASQSVLAEFGFAKREGDAA